MRAIRLCRLMVICSVGVIASAQQSRGQENPTRAASRPTAPAPESRPRTVSVKEGVEHLLKKVRVKTSAIALAAHVSGTVVVGVQIDTMGKVTQVVVLSGPEMLRSAALEAVQQYVYRPFVIDGVAAVVRTAVQVQFNPGAVSSS